MTMNRGDMLAAENTQCIDTNPAIVGLQWDSQEIAELTAEVGEIASGARKRSDSGIPLVERALTVHEKAFGPEHPTVALSLNTLAGLYLDRGDFAKAEPLYHRALAILENVFGPEHPDVATSLDGLAGLYRGQGDYARAERLHDRALRILDAFCK